MTDLHAEHPTSDLLAYWLDELDEAAANAVEEHLFHCDACGARLRELIKLGSSVRGALLKGSFKTVVTPAFIQRLRGAGVQLREYHVEPGNSVNCTITPDDDLVISHLRVNVGDARQIDLVIDDGEGGSLHRSRHVPFDAAAGEVTVIPPVALVRTMAASRQRMRLFAVGQSSERLLGEYGFDHSPHDPRA
jgi:putative zinc finger protein